jgi:hypothetical protein
MWGIVKKQGTDYMEKVSGNPIADTGRRMQETAQQLFMATQNLEKNNKELEKTMQMEHRLNERFRANIEYFSNIAVKTTDGGSHRK